jgi:hypothetical protein
MTKDLEYDNRQVKVTEINKFTQTPIEERKSMLNNMFMRVKWFLDDTINLLRITNKDVGKITERICKYRDAVIEQYEKRETPIAQNIVIERPLTLDYISKDLCKDDVIKTKIEKVQFNQKMKKTKNKKI